MFILNTVAQFIGYLVMSASVIVFVVLLISCVIETVEWVQKKLDKHAEEKDARRRRADFRKWQRELDQSRHPASRARQMRVVR